MKKHTKIYMDFFGYDIPEDFKSELSGCRANDIHHIICKGMGGSKNMDFIENLIALTRSEHEQYGDKKQHMLYLYINHIKFIKLMRPDYNIDYEKLPLAFRNDDQIRVG